MYPAQRLTLCAALAGFAAAPLAGRRRRDRRRERGHPLEHDRDGGGSRRPRPDSRFPDDGHRPGRGSRCRQRHRPPLRAVYVATSRRPAPRSTRRSRPPPVTCSSCCRRAGSAITNAEYAAALAEIPEGPAKAAGISVGQQCAAETLDRRATDGLADAALPVYVPSGLPGDYDFTPPFNFALFPGLGPADTVGHRSRRPHRARSRPAAQPPSTRSTSTT